MKQTLQTLLTCGREQLRRKGSPEPELDAKYLLLEAFRTDMVHFLMNRSQELPETEQIREMAARYQRMIAQRGKRIPLQQILGTQEFMGLEFYVNRHVLIPRQDTEALVELVLKEHPKAEENVLDLCTGSGCIALSLAVLGHYGQITAVDLSGKALEVAEKNKAKLLNDKQKNRVRFLKGDLFAALPPLEFSGQNFSLLISNPPYIPTQVIEGLEPEVRDYEPRMALDGSEDGLLFYRRIAVESRKYLTHEAAVYLEIGYDQGPAVRELLQAAGFAEIRIIADDAGNPRIAAARWRQEQNIKYD